MNKLDTLKVVDDQHGSPTWTQDLTGLVRTILQSGNEQYGTYHLSGEGDCTWYAFAREIYRLGREVELITSECTITPCTSEEFPTPAKRPVYSLLSKDKVKKTFSYVVPSWEESLRFFVADFAELHNRVSNWIEHADYDLDTADVMHKQGKYFYTAFMCQQTLEKILKAYSEFLTGSFKYSHDLNFLAKSLKIDIKEDDEEFFDELNLAYIKSRYSDRIERLQQIWTENKSGNCLNQTKELSLWLKAKIPFYG